MKTASPSTPAFQWRALVTMTVTLSFAVMVASGVVLFLAPPGRVANWTNWTMGGLLKSEWTNLHINFAAIFLGAVVFHIYFNFRPMLSYLKNRVRRRIGFRPEWAAALVVSGLITAGTLAGVTPFSSLIAFSETLKESWEAPNERAPIPHAELLSVAELAEQAKVPLERALAHLSSAGVTVTDASARVADVAAAAGLSAQQLYALITPQKAGNGRLGGGYGWKTLAQFCEEEGIPLALAKERLAAAGFQVDEAMTLRELAQLNGQERPAQLLEIIRGEPMHE